MKARVATVCVKALLAALPVLSLVVLLPGAAGAASTEHVFDPVRSLNGECGTSKADPVPDPGLCPMPPGVAAVDHPSTPFSFELEGLAVDPSGDVYVWDFRNGETAIMVFGPAGEYLTEIGIEGGIGGPPAVDSSCRVYVPLHNEEFTSRTHTQLIRYAPASCPPAKGAAYTKSVVVPVFPGAEQTLALDSDSGNLFAAGMQYRPDGTIVGVNEVQQLTVGAIGGSFNLRWFSDEAADGIGGLVAGSKTIGSVVSAAGNGNLQTGSSSVTSFVTTAGAFAVGEPISGPGIQAGTTVAEVTHGTSEGFLRLSRPATSSETAAPLETASVGSFRTEQEIGGVGLPAGTKVQEVKPASDSLVVTQAATANMSDVRLSAGLSETATSTGGSGSGEVEEGSATVTGFASAHGSGSPSSGSAFVEHVVTTTGEFSRGQTISGAGIPSGTVITSADGSSIQMSKRAETSGAGVSLMATDPISAGEEVSGSGVAPGTTVESLSGTTLDLSAPATASDPDADLSFAIPFDATPTTVEAALEAIPAIGTGSVSVGGGPAAAAPYSITFGGPLESTDVAQLGVEDVNLAGGEGARVATTTPGYDGTFGGGTGLNFKGVAVDAKAGELFLGTANAGVEADIVCVFDLADGRLKRRIDGAEVPGGQFVDSLGVQLAVDEETGELFVDDLSGAKRTYRFVRASDGSYAYLPDPQLEQHSYAETRSVVAVDNGTASPNRGYVYITSGNSPVGHLYAFGPPSETSAPIVGGTSFSGVTTTESTLHGTVNPGGAETRFRFQYVPEGLYRSDVEEFGPGHGFDHASKAGEGALPVGNQPVAVEASVSSLLPGTRYRFRLVAENRCEPQSPEAACVTEGEQGEQGAGPEVPHVFRTYAADSSALSCPNQTLRSGPSQGLPDCRAYELVTPADTGAKVPSSLIGSGNGAAAFATQLASPAGDSVLFMTNGGVLPGLEGSGSTDGYEARRGPAGWQSQIAGPSGAQAVSAIAGGASADHSLWAWVITDNGGSLSNPALQTNFPTYIRDDSGAFTPVGKGSLATDPAAQMRWISPDASHLVFTSKLRLEPAAAAPERTSGENVYDTTADGTTHVVSQLVSGPVPDGETIRFRGASVDGSAVAFSVGKGGGETLCVRLRDAETETVEVGPTTFAALSADGARLTYLKGGDIFSFSTTTSATTEIGSGGESTVVNVSADGSRVYFVSPKVLATGAQAGKENLYVGDASGGPVGFIGILEQSDVFGEQFEGRFGLGAWTAAANSEIDSLNGPALDPSRSTPDGRYIVFESSAGLAGHDAGGHTQIYRYDAIERNLACVSCNPSLAAPTSAATLQAFGEPAPLNAVTATQNISDDGARVFFESVEPLVPTDTNGRRDVYEWREDGVDGCASAEGCLGLISSGHDGKPSYLYAAAPNGSDVFFTSTAELVGRDTDTTSSIYDARIDGGFPEEAAAQPCVSEACRELPAVPPRLSQASNATGTGNVRGVEERQCGHGSRKVRRHGMTVRCVRVRHHRSHHRKRHGDAKPRGDHHKGRDGR